LVKVQPAGDANAESLARSRREPALTSAYELNTTIDKARSSEINGPQYREPSQVEVFQGPRRLQALALEGKRARSRNEDGKNVPDATKALKTVACLNVTLPMRKLGAQFRYGDAVL
jgi:hypothetical protein